MSRGTSMISPAEAQAFQAEGMEQFEHLLIGEQEAKLGVLVAMASGLNVVLVGDPGGGKTTLAANSHRLVEGIANEDVATVPPQSDLMPQQLIGGTTEITKTTTTKTGSRNEKTQATVDALVKPHTKVIFANEINRINPYAVNGILEALESGLLVTTAGNVELTDLEYAVSTMNPSETRQGTFPMAAAIASRHAIGAVLGEDGKRQERIETILNNLEDLHPDKLEPVVNLTELHAIRRRALEGTAIPKNIQGEARDLIEHALDQLKNSHGIREADGRFVKQVAMIAKTHAALGGQEVVDMPDITQAVRFVTMGRLGILGTGNQDTSVRQAVDQIASAV